MITREEQAANRIVDARYVADTYKILPVAYQVTHPTDPTRSYTVTLNPPDCDCMDFVCRARPNDFLCKHILAVALLMGIDMEPDPMPFLKGGIPTNDAGFIACVDPDPNDPYKD